MRTVLCAMLLMIGVLPYAYGQAASKDKFLPIVFDDWWNIDYVKNGCEMAAQYGKPCPAGRTPKDVVREFENELEVVFASEGACHGLSLSHLTPEMINEAVKNPSAPAKGKMATAATGDYWSLILDLDGRSHTQAGQGWTLVDSAHHSFNGEIKTPQYLIQQICKITKGVGGKAEN